MNDMATLQDFFSPVETGRNLEDYKQIKENILIVAPHPDDDVLGAGGYMASAAEKKKQVFVVYITDGAGSPRRDKHISDAQMVSRREVEAISALRLLRAKGAFFLRFNSKELPAKFGQVKGILTKILDFLMPEVIFIPAPYERHKTHLLCTQISLEALRACPIKNTHVFGYSIWGNFWGGHKRIIFDITPYIKDKIQAVLAHETQIAYKNYQQGILGKNNYEAIFWESHEIQKSTFAEIFLDMNILLQNTSLSLADFIRQDMEAFINIYLSQ
ncbi:MAG: PIG-L deacetylase family protein [bacterium]